MNAGLAWLVDQMLASGKTAEEIPTVAEAKDKTLAHLEKHGPTRLPKLQRIMKRGEHAAYQILRTMVRDKQLESVKLNQYLTYYRIPGDKRAFKEK